MSTIIQTCFCGTEFETEKKPFEPLERDCPKCQEERRALEAKYENQRREENREKFKAAVDDMTPHRFTLTDIRDPRFNPQLWAKVAAWKPTAERPWLGLIGAPGKSKSRCAYLRLEQFAIEEADAGGRRFDFSVITGMELGRLVIERRDDEKAARALRHAHTADVLLFDEMGKAAGTKGTIKEIFGLLDYRHSHNLATIWTSNTDPQTFCAAWGEEHAKPGCGRILEASTIIHA